MTSHERSRPMTAEQFGHWLFMDCDLAVHDCPGLAEEVLKYFEVRPLPGVETMPEYSSSGTARDLAEELREYTAMKYAGDCKCGKCQLVPRALVERIYHTLNSIPDPAQGSLEPISKAADDVVSRVCEWDDRTSPDDFPEALLITPSELHRELMRFAEDIGACAVPSASSHAQLASDCGTEIKRLRTQVEYWRLAAERREARMERSGIDVAEARTLDTPSAPSASSPAQCAPDPSRDDLICSIQQAAQALSEHVDEFHDFDYQPHEVPAELQALRNVQHHLEGSLINSRGETPTLASAEGK